MRTRMKLLETLELYRQSSQELNDCAPQLSERVVMAWIFHDNLLEGRTFKPEEIQVAIRRQDHTLPSYLRPLLEDIRIYETAIEMICRWASQGIEAFTVENLAVLHRHLLQNEPSEAAKVRKTSPVHRDYHQEICAPREIKKRLESLFEAARKFDVLHEDSLNFAAHLHHQLMHIYPYRRQPGTLARLMTNFFLLAHGYPPIILASHERGTYYDALAAHQTTALSQMFYQAAWRYMDSIPQGRLTSAKDKKRKAVV